MRPMNHYKGHLFVHLFKENKKKKMFIHRLVAIHFIVNIYGKEVVNHKDEDKKNNHHTNLEWMTSGENTRYSIPTRMKKAMEDALNKKTLNILNNEMGETNIKKSDSKSEHEK